MGRGGDSGYNAGLTLNQAYDKTDLAQLGRADPSLY